ncbi:uncharacterized protein LOC125683218 isoform X2 [Ostrea edulis]|uniref:uncharacterized protein LOC125683218 isoform X2 n=1 Tax=Ostrea edulis TaxID=37623 RepID=UPI0024AF7AE4|nr:uncharacterized protein LOC125683218 isoform X2 [Ostrea edulis]
MEIPICTVIFIMVVFLVLRSEGNSEKREKEKRILLNDPDLINSEIEALRREVQALTNAQTTYQSKITSLENKILQSNRGISSGRQYTNPGSGSNTLCLPHNPDPTPVDYPKHFQLNDPSVSGSIFGAEYEFTYRNIAIDDDVPCAVCVVSNAALMVPAKTSCPVGWTVQYIGVLTSGSDYSGHYGTDYLCLDENPEYMTEGARMHNYDGKLFYPVHAECGSLPCPPYKSKQLISCVVCSN